MQYFGGKERISRGLSGFINERYLNGNNKPFVDLFCGSCNIVTKIDSDRMRIANDKHKYIIAMWKELQLGWQPPKNCTEAQYKYVRENIDVKPHVSGFIGFGCSFGGKWWGGFARGSESRNYCLNAYNSTMKKLVNLKDVQFNNLNYDEVDIPVGSVVYCDIPYENTTQYSSKEVGKFDHDKFYDWVRENKDKYTILISEYKHNVREGFEIVWEKESKQDIRNKENKQAKTVEILMICR